MTDKEVEAITAALNKISDRLDGVDEKLKTLESNTDIVIATQRQHGQEIGLVSDRLEELAMHLGDHKNGTEKEIRKLKRELKLVPPTEQ